MTQNDGFSSMAPHVKELPEQVSNKIVGRDGRGMGEGTGASAG